MLYFYTITKGNFIIITFLIFQVFFQFFVQLLQTEILVTKQAIHFQSILSTYLTSHSGDKFAASLLLQQVNNFIANSCQSLSKQDNEKAASNTSHPSRNKDKKKQWVLLNTTGTQFAGLSLHFPRPSFLLCSSGAEEPGGTPDDSKQKHIFPCKQLSFSTRAEEWILQCSSENLHTAIFLKKCCPSQEFLDEKTVLKLQNHKLTSWLFSQRNMISSNFKECDNNSKSAPAW